MRNSDLESTNIVVLEVIGRDRCRTTLHDAAEHALLNELPTAWL